MPQNMHVEVTNTDDGHPLECTPEPSCLETLPRKADRLAQGLKWLPNTPSSSVLADCIRTVTQTLGRIFADLRLQQPASSAPEDLCWLYDNEHIFFTELQSVSSLKILKKTPHVRDQRGAVVPRILAVAESFLEAVDGRFSEQEFSRFVQVFQRTTVLRLREVRALPAALELLLLARIASKGEVAIRNPRESQGIGLYVTSLRDASQTLWKEVLEPLIVMDQILRQDPAGVYADMDFESRELYRKRIADFSEHSDANEMKVAEAALSLAQEAARWPREDPRIALRESHVGYYLIDRGAPLLASRIALRPPFGQKIQGLLCRYPNEFFLVGIAVLTLAISSAAVLLLTDPSNSLSFIALALLVVFLPSSQAAVQIMNYLVTAILPPNLLPKLDFSEAIPEDCRTLVVVPSLLFDEKQVRNLVEDLEVRFLGNHDPNIHFALLTDLPDSGEPAPEDSGLVAYCASLICNLNEKYATQGIGSFFLFHRHRTYNPREKAWMGWERKRGKLLDLNKFLRGQFDSFPVKVGNVSVLPRVRFVITLDSDTELPRGTAHRLIGTLAHPLNQAVIDREKNIIIAGYGILQPRVGISVQSTANSRLAAIYAGETGFDIYTRAISDAYQDLYAEGSYTGKGIYEVDALHRVLDRRFPRNSLLSHDLIEGAYARAGLVSDIEVIEDYPSHYSAYNRRKHRWLRGDWQIAGWLLPRVPDESGNPTANPISIISWWKICDNLRRSLVEPAIFLLLVFGWLAAACNPWRWTLAALCILFMPVCFQLAANAIRAVAVWDLTVAGDALNTFYTANVNVFFMLTFLAHQTLLSLDAVTRVLVRRCVTKQHLLEWETAAKAEMGIRAQTPLDLYLKWALVFSAAVGIIVWTVRPHALEAALPVLLLWGCSDWVSTWLNRTPAGPSKRISWKDLRFLRTTALRTWRYFAEFTTAEHNWLIPDNVQEQPAAVACRASPTNIGLLLNARQAACEFGYLTLTEFVEQTRLTLATVNSLQKHRGHLLNWYDTHTLAPLKPLFVSSVDSGNLLASLWTLQHGCLEKLRQPVLQPCLAEGLADYVRALIDAHALPRKVLAACVRRNSSDNWLSPILRLPDDVFQNAKPSRVRSKRAAGLQWLMNEAASRVKHMRLAASHHCPWLALEFYPLRDNPTLDLKLLDTAPLEQLPQFIDALVVRIDANIPYATQGPKDCYERFRDALLGARENVVDLIAGLRFIAAESARLAREMDFKFLLNRHRKLLSVGFDLESQSLNQACYDLLATESRTAIFIAIAKEDIPQECWFRLGRTHTMEKGRSVLLSWTGTLFEYLMPSLWMRSYPNTLLKRSCLAAVRSQQADGLRKYVPWGISESAYCKLDESGNYQYYAFGLRGLALHKPEINRLVISPYSTFLALAFDPAGSLQNLKRMSALKWLGDYGFYEAADFSGEGRRFWQRRWQLARCWMVHHQGMSLLALANFLNGNVIQRWFHNERRVLATELLLHEKPVAHLRKRDIVRRLAA